MRKKSTRLLSAALAVCMMLSVLPVGAFAAEPGAAEPENGVSAQEETEPYHLNGGETVNDTFVAAHGDVYELSGPYTKSITVDTTKNVTLAQKNYLCHSLHIPPQVFIMRYIARFFGINSVCFSRISTLFSITFQQNGVVMVYQTVLYQPDIFRSCRSDDPGKATSFAICSAAWS